MDEKHQCLDSIIFFSLNFFLFKSLLNWLQLSGELEPFTNYLCLDKGICTAVVAQLVI